MTDPLWADASGGLPAYSSAELRRLMAVDLQYNGRVLGARQGVRPGGTGLDTTIAGSTITVKAGTAIVDPALTTTQGPYRVVIATDETFTLTAAHATLPRKDITILRVYDHTEDSSGFRKAQSEYVVGTAAGSPSEPAVPAGAFRLATIDVPASGGGSPVVTINKPFTVAAGGILPIRNVTERGLITPYDGMVIERIDRSPRWLEMHDGTAWRVQGLPICTTTSDRDTAITNPHAGLLTLVTADNLLYRYTGSAWVNHGFYRATQLLVADAASVTFSSIPSTFKNLRIVWAARSTQAVVIDELRMRVNGDSATNYWNNVSIHQNVTVTLSANSGLTYTFVGQMAGASAQASAQGSGEIVIPGWDAPGSRAALNMHFHSHVFDSAANSSYSQGGALYNAAGPFTSVTFLPSAGNLKAGSEFTVYGWE